MSHSSPRNSQSPDSVETDLSRNPDPALGRRSFLHQLSASGTCLAAAGMLTNSQVSLAKDETATGGKVTDFTRSFLRWTMDTKVKPPKTVSKPLPMTLNRVRMPIEAVATLKHEATGTVFRYALGSECRAEQVWVKRDIWHDPNASMCMIGGETESLIEKHWARADFEAHLYPPKLGIQPERQFVVPQDAFTEYKLELPQVPAVEMKETKDILQALSGSDIVVARTTYQACGYHITLEYIVKTSNYSEREDYYQVDTGPIIFPGLTDIGAQGESPLKACRLAYIAHNAPDWAELIVCVPTVVKDDLKVHHFSQIVRLDGIQNHMFRVL